MPVPSTRLGTICRTIRAYIIETNCNHAATQDVHERLITALDVVITAQAVGLEITTAQHRRALEISKIFASAAAVP